MWWARFMHWLTGAQYVAVEYGFAFDRVSSIRRVEWVGLVPTITVPYKPRLILFKDGKARSTTGLAGADWWPAVPYNATWHPAIGMTERT